MTYQTGKLPEPFNRYGVATELIHTKDYLRLFYHATEVAAIHKTPMGFMLYLQHDGYTTPTTKKRINHFLQYSNLPFHVFQKNYIWYISTPRGVVEWQGREMMFKI